MQFIRFEEAIEKIHSMSLQLGTEKIKVVESLGRILAEEIVGDRDLPAYDRAMMDGIAVSDSTKTEGRISGILFAGESNEKIPEDFELIEIMTGAMVPSKTHGIIPKEQLTFFEKNGEKWVSWKDSKLKKGDFIHFRGMDSQKGEKLVLKGKKLHSLDIALAQSVGLDEILVEKRPKIAILSTGDELVPVGEKPKDYQIRSSNSGMLAALLIEKGYDSQLFHLKDDKTSLLRNLEEIIQEHAILLITGGVSAGKKDYLPECLEALSIQKIFHKIAQKPGKPLWFGKHLKKNTYVFAFPGNPISTYLGAKIYFLPWLLKNEIFKGYCEVENPHFQSSDLDLWLPFQWKEKNSIARILNHHGSGDMVSWSKADGFLLKKANQEGNLFPFLDL